MGFYLSHKTGDDRKFGKNLLTSLFNEGIWMTPLSARMVLYLLTSFMEIKENIFSDDLKCRRLSLNFKFFVILTGCPQGHFSQPVFSAKCLLTSYCISKKKNNWLFEDPMFINIVFAFKTCIEKGVSVMGKAFLCLKLCWYYGTR
jgi:hypothetical protein